MVTLIIKAVLFQVLFRWIAHVQVPTANRPFSLNMSTADVLSKQHKSKKHVHSVDGIKYQEVQHTPCTSHDEPHCDQDTSTRLSSIITFAPWSTVSVCLTIPKHTVPEKQENKVHFQSFDILHTYMQIMARLFWVWRVSQTQNEALKIQEV